MTYHSLNIISWQKQMYYTRRHAKHDGTGVKSRPRFESYSGVISSVSLRTSRKTSSLGFDFSPVERGYTTSAPHMELLWVVNENVCGSPSHSADSL